MVAGIELLRIGACGAEGLPLAGLTVADADGAERPLEEALGLAGYDDLVFGGWDLSDDDLAKAASVHGVLGREHAEAVGPVLSQLRPWPAVANADFCRNVVGSNVVGYARLREQVEAVRADLRAFRADRSLDAVVVVNLASTERWPDLDDPSFATPEAFEAAVDADAAVIPPAMVYAYAALLEGMPHVNFTPSVAKDVPALLELARRRGVPVTGKDGKTGQTLLKTVIAPGAAQPGPAGGRVVLHQHPRQPRRPRARRPLVAAEQARHQGLGARRHPGLPGRGPPGAHRLYRPRGDDKEAWDNIDVTGFLGQPMQIKVNLLARGSVLAAPLGVGLVRLLDLAAQRGESGAQEQLGYFFKAPVTDDPATRPEHALHLQERALLDWLTAGRS